MRIEEGRFYKTRDGRKAGPLESHHAGDEVFFGGGVVSDQRAGRAWRPDGAHDFGDHNLDLIAEWIDGPVRTETVTRKVIVPGRYGRLKVFRPGDGPHAQVQVAFVGTYSTEPMNGEAMGPVDLRAAAATFIELADALEQQPEEIVF